MAGARRQRWEAVKQLRDSLAEWVERQGEDLSDNPVVAEALAKLDASIERGEIVREGLDQALELAEQVISANKHRREAREDALKALDEGALLSEAAEAYDSLSARAKELEAEFLSTVLKLPATDTSQRADGGDRVGTEQVETDELGTASPGDSTSQDAVVDELAVSEPEDAARERGLEDVVPSMPTEDVEELEEPRGSSEEPSGALIRSVGEGALEVATLEGGHAGSGEEVVARPGLVGSIESAINRGHFGVAYNLASSAPDSLLSADLVKLVACNHASDDLSPVRAELPNVAHALLANLEQRAEVETAEVGARSFAVLGICAALQPALIAPGGPVAQLLGTMEAGLGGMSSLRALAKAASEVSTTGLICRLRCFVTMGQSKSGGRKRPIFARRRRHGSPGRGGQPSDTTQQPRCGGAR